MATSIDDLIAVLDDATSVDAEPCDASRALHHCSRILDRLLSDGVEAVPSDPRNVAVRRLAESCADVATAFEQDAGRISDLVAAEGDAVGVLRRELTGADRWVIATSLAPVARRRSAAIVSSGPYSAVPELPAVSQNARDLQRVAASTPPDLNQVRALDLPIPDPGISGDRPGRDPRRHR